MMPTETDSREYRRVFWISTGFCSAFGIINNSALAFFSSSVTFVSREPMVMAITLKAVPTMPGSRYMGRVIWKRLA